MRRLTGKERVSGLRSFKLLGLVFEKSFSFQVRKVGVGGIAENLNVRLGDLDIIC